VLLGCGVSPDTCHQDMLLLLLLLLLLVAVAAVGLEAWVVGWEVCPVACRWYPLCLLKS